VNTTAQTPARGAGGKFQPGAKAASNGKAKEPEKLTVKMEDGRSLDFVGKRRVIAEHVFGLDGDLQATSFAFRSGAVRTFGTLASNLVGKAVALALRKRVSDVTMNADNDTEALEAVDELLARLAAGQWAERNGTGTGQGSVLARAMVEYSNGTRTLEQAKAYLKTLSQGQKYKLRESAGLKDIIARLEAEEAGEDDTEATEALLAAF
jgi:hypothetical protein